MNKNILKSKLSKKVIITAIFLILSLILVPSVSAVDITLEADYDGGINEAVNNVSTSIDSSNTITLNPGIYNKTTDRNNNINDKNLTIQGRGPSGSVIIDANKTGRIFTITGNSNITFINITFINGNITGNGGAIYSNGGIITLINCIFINNTATNYGGAIHNEASGFTVTNSTFTDNTANDDGGAISNYLSSGFTVNNSTFTDNTAKNDGGAIYNYDGSGFTVSNSTFINNSAKLDGGAISNSLGDGFTVANSNFINNSANDGGAIYNSGDGFTMTNSTLTNNTAKLDGGAIYNSGDGFTMTNSTLTNNTANDGSGGAIDNWFASGFSVTNSTFIDNTANDGGAIYNNHGSDFTVTNSTFTDNTANDGSGGAIYNSGDSMTVIGSNFINNTAKINGNAIVVRDSVGVNINYNRFVNNDSRYAVYIDDFSTSSYDIDYNWWGNNTFNSNIAPNNYYVVNFKNITSLENRTIGDKVIFKYSLVLNGTNDSTGVDKLPYFASILNYNEKINLWDARNTTNLAVILAKTNNTFISITDNAVFSLNSVAFDPKTTLTIIASKIVEGKKLISK